MQWLAADTMASMPWQSEDYLTTLNMTLGSTVIWSRDLLPSTADHT